MVIGCDVMKRRNQVPNCGRNDKVVEEKVPRFARNDSERAGDRFLASLEIP